MKFMITSLLLASLAVAIPTPASRPRRRLGGRNGSSLPARRVAVPLVDLALTPSKTFESYSSNWAGVVIESPPSGTFTAVSATFTIPMPQSNGGSESQSASAWVGIDGDTCGSAILQTGVDFTVNTDSSVTLSSWYEWFPDYAHDFTGISFEVGDVVALSVQSTSSTTGSTMIHNLSNGQNVTQQLNSSAVLCGQNAEWIVEDFSVGGGLVPFVDFGSVTFTNATAQTSDGKTVSSATGGLIDIQQNGKTLTSTSQDGDSLTVKML